MSLLLSLYSNIYYVITETDIKKDVFHLFMSMRRRKNSESYTCDKTKTSFSISLMNSKLTFSLIQFETNMSFDFISFFFEWLPYSLLNLNL